MVDVSREPKDWGEALVAAGYTNRRTGKGGSWTALADAIGVHVSTLTSMAAGTRATEQEILDKVAEALSVDPRTKPNRRKNFQIFPPGYCICSSTC